MSDVKTEFLFNMIADVDRDRMVDVGATPQGIRRIFYITGGSIEGPKIKGVVLPGGADWLIVRPDGASVIDVRIAIRTDDGHIIYMYYRGITTISPEQRQRLKKGDVVDPSGYYFRTTPVFETASEKYDWLNRIVAVGIGTTGHTQVSYKVHAIL